MKKYLFILALLVVSVAAVFIIMSCKKSSGDCATVPPTPVPHSNSPVKAGDTIRLGCSTVTNATYHWTGPNGFTKDGQDVKIANSTTAMAGDYKVTATVDGCTSSSGKITVEVFQLKSFNFMGNTVYIYPEDAHPSGYNYPWNNGGNTLTNATNDIDGRANTNTITGSQGPGDYAAYVCQNLIGLGFSDWYLPSKDELQRIYELRLSLGNNFVNECYWSSSESTVNNAWYLNFATGVKDVESKYNPYRVRCVRK